MTPLTPVWSWYDKFVQDLVTDAGLGGGRGTHEVLYVDIRMLLKLAGIDGSLHTTGADSQGEL